MIWLILWLVICLIIGAAAGFWLGVLAGESAAYYHLYRESLTEEPDSRELDGPRSR